MYLTQALHRSVQQTPDAPATIFGDRVRSFAEQHDRVARLAGALRRLGVEPGDRVAMLALNSDRYTDYLYATPWADAVLNPVNTRWSEAEMAYAVDDCETKVLFVDATFADRGRALEEHCPSLVTLVWADDGPAPVGMADMETLITETEPVPDARRGGDALAALFYTGGTTGQAKGVMLSHANLLTQTYGALASGALVTPRGRLLHVAPMFHLADLALWMMSSTLGGTHVILPGFDPGAALEAIARHQITDLLLVPTMLQALVDHPAAASAELGSVRRVAYGASPISEALVQRVMKRFRGAGLTQGYGMTEVSAIATLLDPADHARPELLRAAGRAAPHAEVRIVDPDDPEDRELPRGTVGEVAIRGGHVMLGYWRQPEATATALRNGWMHTGDGAYMDNAGYVFIVDRIKDMIVSGGENVYSAEVENALASHPAVAMAAVIGVPDPDWGERVHAVVVLAPGAAVTPDALREHCKQRIAGYKAPRSVEFVDALPLSAAGKVLKRELRQRHWSEAGRLVG
ncbi:MAG: long-chain fatty acid--CoA ligase [Actinomycetota bacterium]|jgi:acyl-CoA synthetase (AMP-forming)/AMP-acid ligase II